MKVAIFKEQLDPYSGFTRHITEVGQRLALRYDYRFTIITSRVLHEMPAGLNVRIVGGPLLSYTHTRRREIRAILDDFQPDLLDYHGGPGAFLFSKDFDRPKVYSMHANKFSLNDYRTVRWRDGLQEGRKLWGPAYVLNVVLPVGLFAQAMQARQPRAVAVPTRALREALERTLECPVHHLPSGVDLKRFHAGLRVEVPRKFPADERLVFFYGKAQLLRGIDTLLQAFLRVRRAVPQARLLLLIRPDVSTKRVLRLVERHPLRAHIHMELATVADTTPYLIMADAVALPFRSPMVLPAQPLTLLEAMAMGKPIVSTSLDVVREIIQDEEEGLLVPPNSPDLLAEGIIRILEDPQLAKRLGDRARAKILTEYNWGRIAERTHEFYQQAHST